MKRSSSGYLFCFRDPDDTTVLRMLLQITEMLYWMSTSYKCSFGLIESIKDTLNDAPDYGHLWQKPPWRCRPETDMLVLHYPLEYHEMAYLRECNHPRVAFWQIPSTASQGYPPIDVINGVRWLDLEGDGCAGEGLDKICMPPLSWRTVVSCILIDGVRGLDLEGDSLTRESWQRSACLHGAEGL